MNDLYVEALIYRLETANNITYDNPPPVDVNYPEFSGRLENDLLTCYMKLPYSSVEDAKKIVEQYLRAWEIEASLKIGRGAIRFIYKDVKLIDRRPSQEGSKITQLAGGIYLISGANATLSVIRKTYPPPPITFRISPDVETLWQRYEGYLEGKEKICSMAYFCLNLIEKNYGGNRNNASRLLNIEKEVLHKLGELTSTKGDPLTARKAPPNGIAMPLSDREIHWIEAVIKSLILRIGEYLSGKTLDKIKMIDFPSLDPKK